MGIVLEVLILSLGILLSLHCGAEVTDADEKAMIERGNERCADFKRLKRDEEERSARREREANLIKKVREEHEIEMRKARDEYIKTRTKTAENPKAEHEWEEQQKAWKEQNKVAAQRWARQQAEVEAIEKRGCHIDENLEYDLED